MESNKAKEMNKQQKTETGPLDAEDEPMAAEGEGGGGREWRKENKCLNLNLIF